MPALVAIPALAALLMILTIYVVWQTSKAVILPALSAALGALPVIGGYLVNRNVEMFNAVDRFITGLLNASVSILVSVLHTFANAVWWLVSAWVTNARLTLNGLVTVYTRWLPALATQAAAYVETRITDAVHYVQAAVLTLRHDVEAGLAALQLLFSAQFLQVAHDLEQARRAAQAGEAATLAAAAAMTTAATKADAQAILDALATARGWVVGVEHEVTLAKGEAIAYAGAVALPLALGLAEIKNLDCIKLCNPLSLVGNAVEALDLAALLLLVAEAANDPKGTARLVEETVAPAVGIGAGLYQALGGK